jgi:two-component system, response regulator PdtaR
MLMTLLHGCRRDTNASRFSGPAIGDDMTDVNRRAATGRDRHSVPLARTPDHRPGRHEGARAHQVLIVEDEFFVALDLETTLQRAGFEVVGVASNAVDAVRLAEAHQPSVVVMDVRIVGDRDGIDAAIEIFERFGIRSVFATAHHDPVTITRAAPANAAGWLVKPYSSEALIAAVEAAVKPPQ